MATKKSTSSKSTSGKSSGRNKVKKVMEEYKHKELKSGKSGKPVKNRKQAIAIALNEARETGAKIPRKGAAKKTAARKTTAKKSPARKTAARKRSSTR